MFVYSVVILTLIGLAKGENVIASCHPTDQLSLNAFKVIENVRSSIESTWEIWHYEWNHFQAIGAHTITENSPVVQKSDVVFVSVKPGVVPSVLQDVKSVASNKLFISVAMGVSISQLENVS